MKTKLIISLLMLSTLAGFGQFRNSAGTAFPYTNNLAAGDVMIIGKPGNTNLNIASSNLLQELAEVAATPNAIPIGITGNSATTTLATNLAAIPMVATYVASVGITDWESSNRIHVATKVLVDAGVLTGPNSWLRDAVLLRSNLNHGTLASIKTFVLGTAVTLGDSGTIIYNRDGLEIPGSATGRAYWTVPDYQTNSFGVQCSTWIAPNQGAETAFVRLWDGAWTGNDYSGIGLIQGSSMRVNLRYAHRTGGGSATFTQNPLYCRAGFITPSGFERNYILSHTPGGNITATSDGVNCADGQVTNYIRSALGTYAKGLTNVQIGHADASYYMRTRVQYWGLFNPPLNAAGERAWYEFCRILDGKPKTQIWYGDSRIVEVFHYNSYEPSWSGLVSASKKFSDTRFYDGARGGSTVTNLLSDLYFTNITQWFGPDTTVSLLCDWNDTQNDSQTAEATWQRYSNLTVKLTAYPGVKVEAILPSDGVTKNVTNQAIHQLIVSNAPMYSRIVPFEAAINGAEFQTAYYNSNGNPHYSPNAAKVYANYYTHGQPGDKGVVAFLPAFPAVTTGAWTWTNIWSFTRKAYIYGGTVTHIDIGTNRVATASPAQIDVPAGMILTVSNAIVPTVNFYP